MAEFKEKASYDKVEAIAVTDKAVLIDDLDGKQRWVPKSQIDDDSEVFDEGHKGTLIVSEWWAKKEGIA